MQRTNSNSPFQIKEAAYEKKEELEVAARESGVMMKDSAIKNVNKGYGSELGKSPVNTGGSWMSKHVKK